MIRSTTLAAHIENEHTGFNSTKRAQVFSYIVEHPGCSRSDIERGIPGMKINCVCGRVNELINSGLISEDGCKRDPLSGKNVNRLFVRAIGGSDV